jgi:hypothetical protein
MENEIFQLWAQNEQKTHQLDFKSHQSEQTLKELVAEKAKSSELAGTVSFIQDKLECQNEVIKNLNIQNLDNTLRFQEEASSQRNELNEKDRFVSL